VDVERLPAIQPGEPPYYYVERVPKIDIIGEIPSKKIDLMHITM
jgi:hypothetical protein